MPHHHDTPVPPHDPAGPAGVTVESLRQAVELGRAGLSGYGTLRWPAAVVVADALAVLLDCWEATHPATPPAADPSPGGAAPRCPHCGEAETDRAVWCCDELMQAAPDR